MRHPIQSGTASAANSLRAKTRNVIGCDIGGANLKLADSSGQCVARPFAMWLKPKQLAAAILEMIAEFQLADDAHLAITMTGELADCFETRRDGVHQILAQVEQAFAPERTHVYAVGNQWLTLDQARAAPWDVAASNWYALATWIGTPNNLLVPHCSVDLVLDIGSTTVDIIPMRTDVNGWSRPDTGARNDRQRLELGQLVYTGLERTPVAAIVRELKLNKRICPVMAERFATSDDCYIVLGLTPEAPDDCDSADNRPRTQANAHARLARMIGEDAETLTIESTRNMAEQIIDAQATQVAEAITRNLARSPSGVTAVGHGRALATRAIAKLSRPAPTVTWLADQISAAAAGWAPALAVAQLLDYHLQDQA